MNIGDLYFALRADGKGLEQDITKQAGKAGDSAGKVMGKRMGTALKVGIGVGVGLAAAAAVRGLTGAISSGVASLRELGVVEAQTNAVIKSTGNAARVTTKHIRALSEATEDKTAIDDKVVQAGANMLLTFTNVRNEVGAGNDIFDQSIGILADMSTALGSDMPKAAIQLGKALNDPVKGVTALRKVGVAFDEVQTKQIKQFVKEGKVIEAQRIILKELNKEFGGSGAAFAATDAGKAAKFQDAIEGIQMSLARALLPAITRVQEALTKFLSDPETMGQAERLGEMIASIFSEGNLKTAASLMTTAASAIGTAFKLFGALPKELQALAVGALVLKKFTGIGPIDIVKTIGGELFKRGGSPANPLFVADVAGGKGIPGLPGKGGFGNIVKATIIGAVVVEGLNLWMQSIQGFVDKNNALGAQGLTPAEIEAKKYYESDTATQQAALKHLGHIPKIEDYESAIAKLAEKRPQTGGKSLEDRDAQTRARAVSDKAEMAAITERAIKAGFHPSQVAIQRTFDNNKAHIEEIVYSMTTGKQDEISAIKETTNAVRALPAQLKNALGGILYTPGSAPGKSKDDVVVVKPSPKPKAVFFAGDSRSEGKIRAKGGPVQRSGTYLVGEKGPELFRPNVDGKIIPNDRIERMWAMGIPHRAGGGDVKATQFMDPQGHVWESKQAWMRWNSRFDSTVGNFGRTRMPTVPRRRGQGVSGIGTIGGSGGSSGSTHVNVNVQGLLRARDPFEVATQLRRLGSFGVLTPRKEPI